MTKSNILTLTATLCVIAFAGCANLAPADPKITGGAGGNDAGGGTGGAGNTGGAGAALIGFEESLHAYCAELELCLATPFEDCVDFWSGDDAYSDDEHKGRCKRYFECFVRASCVDSLFEGACDAETNAC